MARRNAKRDATRRLEMAVEVAADALQCAVKKFLAAGGSVDDAAAWLLARTLTLDARIERAGRRLLKTTRLGPLSPICKLQAFPSPNVEMIGEDT